jgi:hypothetical protein
MSKHRRHPDPRIEAQAYQQLVDALGMDPSPETPKMGSFATDRASIFDPRAAAKSNSAWVKTTAHPPSEGTSKIGSFGDDRPETNVQ